MPLLYYDRRVCPCLGIYVVGGMHSAMQLCTQLSLVKLDAKHLNSNKHICWDSYTHSALKKLLKGKRWGMVPYGFVQILGSTKQQKDMKLI